jgi:hypothetical protein
MCYISIGVDLVVGLPLFTFYSVLYQSVINMYYIQLERGENFLQFDIKFALENMFI